MQFFTPVSSYLLSSVGNLNLVYIIHIYNALENSLKNATGGVLEKIINKNPDQQSWSSTARSYTESWL